MDLYEETQPLPSSASLPPEQRLRDERFRLALRASSEGIWDWNLATGGIYYSRQALNLLGFGTGPAPNILADARSHLHPEDFAGFVLAIDTFLRNPARQEPFAVECRFRTATGEYLWFRVRAVAAWDRSGRPVRLVGTLANITPRKNAEAALSEERHLLRQLIDTIPVNIYFKDLESRFTLVNRAIARWFGCVEPQELIGKADADFFAPEHAEKALRDEQEIIRTGLPLVGDVEKETWSQKGDTWVLTTKMPLRDRAGAIKGTFGVSSDVTELVRTQRALSEAVAELEEKNRRIEEEIQLAREVQQALLPRSYPCFPPDASPGQGTVRFAHRYLPIEKLAGDFFQVVPLSGSAVGVLLCDVMGHGVRSALVAAVLRGMAQEERGAAHDPGAFLARLNAGLLRILAQVDETVFVTAFYLVVDLANQSLVYANAAHPRPVWISRRSQDVGRLPDPPSGRGPVLGLFADASYATVRHGLDAIDSVVLFTDGIYETDSSSGETCPEERFLSFFQRRIREEPDALLDGVIADALAFSEGRRFIDDVCLVDVEIARGLP